MLSAQRTLEDTQYFSLVQKRKNCAACYPALSNPSTKPEFDSNDIGPWSIWQNSLSADLMIVGQDWGGVQYYLKHRGRDENSNLTNKNLIGLLDTIGISINGPEETYRDQKTSDHQRVFFTNAVLCLKEGSLAGAVQKDCFRKCGSAFLKPLIELVHPKGVIALGKEAYYAVASSFDLEHLPLKTAVECEQGILLTRDIRLFPVFHCGYWGVQKNRGWDNQVNDWKKIGEYLKTP